MSKRKGPSWFKVQVENNNLLQVFDDESLGQGFRFALNYAATGSEPQTDNILAMAVFNALKPGVDECIEGYLMAVQTGREGAYKRWRTKRKQQRDHIKRL